MDPMYHTQWLQLFKKDTVFGRDLGIIWILYFMENKYTIRVTKIVKSISQFGELFLVV